MTTNPQQFPRIAIGSGDTSGNMALVDINGALSVNVVEGTITATNPSVGTNLTTAPTSSTEVGGVYNTSAPAPTNGQLVPLQVDSSGNLKVISTSSPPPVTRYTGQVKIATTNTAVQLNATSYVMNNGAVVTAHPNNASPTIVGGVIGISTVTDATDGTGAGNLIQPGSSVSVGSGVNMSTLYVNGIIGDIFFYEIS